MREILFRGKRIDNGEWVYGYYARKGADEESFRHYICVSTFSSDCQSNYTYPFYLYDYEVDPSTIGQYTGLTDKNGKMIFEGDIVRDIAVWHEEEIQVKSHVNIVGVDKGCWIIFHDKWWDFLYTNASDVEIIGNIHDSPELLEA